MALNVDLLKESLRPQKPKDEEEEEERQLWSDKGKHRKYHGQIEEVANIETHASGWRRLV